MSDKIKLTIGVIITLILVSGGTYYLSDGDTAYSCESRDMAMICDKLSSGIGTRCYYQDTYKTCKEGWIKLELKYQSPEENLTKTSKIKSSNKIRCNQTGCVKI